MDRQTFARFLKGRQVFELKDARVRTAYGNPNTGRIEITFESADQEAFMRFPHRLVMTVLSSLNNALGALPHNEERDRLLEPYPGERVAHDFGLGDASVVAADSDCVHVLIHARNAPETLHLMLNRAETERFAEMAKIGYSSLTPKERAKSDVLVSDPGFE